MAGWGLATPLLTHQQPNPVPFQLKVNFYYLINIFLHIVNGHNNAY